MNSQRCAGCQNTLKGLQLLQCCKCDDKFHYTCVNFNKKDFDSFSKDFIQSWVCPSCRCKEPKKGDNSNTPIRGAISPATSRLTDSATGAQYDNVTLRTKPRSSSNCDCLSAEAIRDIIREELDRKLNTNLKEISNKLQNFEETLTFFDSKFDSIIKENEAQKVLINKLHSENQELRNNTSDLKQRLQHLEQLSRTNNLEIQCVPEHSSENLYSTVQQLGKTIKCPVVDTDLQYCSRIAKLNTSSPRPRSILVKFSSRRLRDTFLAGVIKYNKSNPADKLNTSHLGYGGSKKTAVFVTEHLTPEAKALHAAARQKAKELNYRFIWVRDGKVFLRKTENSSFILVKDKSVLNNLA